MKICLDIPSALVSLYLDIRGFMAGGARVKPWPLNLLVVFWRTVMTPRFPFAFQTTVNMVCAHKWIPA